MRNLRLSFPYFGHAILALSAGTLALSAVACGGSSPASSTPAPSSTTAPVKTATAAAANIPTVNVTAKDYSYDAPETVPAGLTHIHMQNAGAEAHQAQLLKLNDGVTLAQFQAALQKGPDAALPLSSSQGGANAEKPGQAADATSNLQPGQYVFICFVPSPDGTPHFAKGMVKSLQVTGAAAPAAQLPPTQNTVTGREFNFTAPSTLPAGQTTFTFTNGGTQPHEMSVVKLNSGVTADQLKAALASTAPPSGPPPFSSEGGMGGISPGESGQTTVNLTSGTYALVCNIPDRNTGKPHAALGMVSSFTVP